MGVHRGKRQRHSSWLRDPGRGNSLPFHTLKFDASEQALSQQAQFHSPSFLTILPPLPVLILFYLPAALLDTEEEEEILDIEKRIGRRKCPLPQCTLTSRTFAFGNDPQFPEVAI